MVTIVGVDAAGLREHQQQLAVIYRQCFAAPPWNEPAAETDGYPDRLHRQTSYPGARGVIARSGTTVVAAAYGWPAPATLPEATEHDRAVRDAVPPELAALLVAPALVVAELMVAPSWQRQGLGRRLLAELVADAPRAWLATHPQAPAVALYEQTGWQRQFTYRAGGHPLVLFTKDLTLLAVR
ncbi:GNAT family N-acetyltransferase [Actinoplanes sp. CA-030573]|uniref:GNAT family N-acetyltransferase n=1 Tax=Actinoplanes sp. CA-030573 TaxID=3239898 RepID=UPI003D8BF427